MHSCGIYIYWQELPLCTLASFKKTYRNAFFFFSVKVKSLPKVGDIVNKMEVNIKHGILSSALPSHYINFLKFSLLPTEILSVFQRQSFL